MALVQLPPEAVVDIQTDKLPIVVKEIDDRNRPMQANTTLQEDLTLHGQRRINQIWEYTQAFIAAVVVMANMVVAVFQGLYGTTREHPVILSSSLFLIVGFYFARTNHSAIGGTGKKPHPEYEGR